MTEDFRTAVKQFVTLFYLYLWLFIHLIYTKASVAAHSVKPRVPSFCASDAAVKIQPLSTCIWHDCLLIYRELWPKRMMSQKDWESQTVSLGLRRHTAAVGRLVKPFKYRTVVFLNIISPAFRLKDFTKYVLFWEITPVIQSEFVCLS